MTLDALFLALMIFVLRILNYAIATIRLVAITRQQRILASVLAFLEALVFAVVIANVVTDLDNLLNLMAYCGGAAAGSYLGMIWETRFITSYRTVNVITQDGGHDMALALRNDGYGVTETIGEGQDGSVTMLRSVVMQRDVSKLLNVVQKINPNAFIAVEEARAVQRGWIRVSGSPR